MGRDDVHPQGPPARPRANADRPLNHGRGLGRRGGSDRRRRVVVVAPRARPQGALDAGEQGRRASEIAYAARTFLAATAASATSTRRRSSFFMARDLRTLTQAALPSPTSALSPGSGKPAPRGLRQGLIRIVRSTGRVKHIGVGNLAQQDVDTIDQQVLRLVEGDPEQSPPGRIRVRRGRRRARRDRPCAPPGRRLRSTSSGPPH